MNPTKTRGGTQMLMWWPSYMNPTNTRGRTQMLMWWPSYMNPTKTWERNQMLMWWPSYMNPTKTRGRTQMLMWWPSCYSCYEWGRLDSDYKPTDRIHGHLWQLHQKLCYAEIAIGHCACCSVYLNFDIPIVIVYFVCFFFLIVWYSKQSNYLYAVEPV